jgi:uncharacterized protein (TIGR03546 family)
MRHHHGAKLLIMVIGKLVLPLAAGPIDALGWWFLHLDALQPLFTSLYNMPFVPFTRFYNTLVAGGLVSGIVLWIPAFVIGFVFVGIYRNTIAKLIRDSKLARFIKKIPFISSIGKAVSGLNDKGA